MMFPLKPDGSKLFPATPEPDQLPLIPLCEVGNVIEDAFSQIFAGIPLMTGVTGVLTAIVVVVEEAHCPAFGVKVNMIFPLRPEGLKLFAETPVPDQLPV
jgi:hypothetical protein